MIANSTPSPDKLTKEQLVALVRDQQNQAFSLLDALPDARMVADAEGNIQYINLVGHQWLATENKDFPAKIQEVFSLLEQDDRWQLLKEGMPMEMSGQSKASLRLQAVWHAPYQVYLLTIMEGTEAIVGDIAEEELAGLQIASHHTQEGTLVVDPQAEYRYISPSMERLTGYSNQELQTLPFEKLVYPDDVPLYQDTVRKIQKNRRGVHQFTYRITQQNGQIRWHQTDINPIVNEQGEIIYTVWVIRDITEERGLIEAYNTVNERYRFIAENANDGFFDWDLEQEQLYRNRKYDELLGLPFKEYISRSDWEQRVYAADLELLQQHLQKSLENRDKRFIKEFRFLKQNQEYRWVRISGNVVRSLNGKPTRIVGTISDIHDQKLAEQRLLEHTEILQAMQVAAKIGQWRFNPKTRALTGSEEFYRIYEIDLASEISVSDQVISRIPAAYMEVAREIINHAVQVREPYHLEYLLTNPSGTQRWVEVIGKVFIEDDQGEVEEIIGLAQDITERKEGELALQESESRYRLLAENASDVICLMSLGGEKLYTTPSIQSGLGYTPEEYVRLYVPEEMIHPDDIPLLTHTIEQLQQGTSRVEVIVFRERHQQGHYVWVEALYKRIEDKSGNPQIMVVARDITQRREAELALQASEVKHRLLAENANDLISLIDLYGNSHYASPSIEKLTGFTPQQWGSKALHERVHPDDAVLIQERLRESIDQEKGYIRYRIRTKDGGYRWMDGNWRFVEDTQLGKKIMVISRDVTEEVKVREELEKHREYFQSTFFNNTTDALFLVDTKSQRIVNCNDTAVTMFGAKHKEELRGQTGHSLWQHEAIDGQAIHSSAYQEGEIQFLTTQGSQFWGTQAVIEFREDTQLIRITDITEQKKAQIALQESEAKYRLLTESALDIITLLDLERKVQYISPSIEKITGFTPDEWMQLNREGKDIHPEDLLEIKRHLVEYPHQRTGDQMRHRIARKDGSYVWMHSKTNLICDKYGEYKIQVVSRDVSQQVQAQQELEESRQYFQSIFDHTTDALFLVDMETQCITDCNDAAVTMFEATDKNALIGRQGVSFRRYPRSEEEEGQILETFSHHDAWKDEVEYISAQGNSFWGNLSIILFKENTQLVRISDVTEQKKAQEKIRESEALYRLLADNATDVVALSTVEHQWKYVSPAVRKVLGYTSEEYSKLFDISSNVHPKDLHSYKHAIHQLKQGKQDVRNVLRARHKNGDWIWLDCVSNLVTDTDGEQCILITARDISGRKAIEQALQESEAKYRLLADNATDLISLIDQQGNSYYISPSVENVLGYTAEEWNFGIPDRVHPDDLATVKRKLTRSAKGATEARLKYRERKKDGSYLWMEGNGKLIKDDQGRNRILVISRDITQEVITKQALEESRQYFQSIFNNTTDALFLVDAKTHTIQDCNTAAVEMFGTTTKEKLIGRKGMEFHRELLAQEDINAAIKRFRKNQQCGSEVEYVSAQGRIFWGNLVSTQFNDTQMLVRVSDITLLKEKEQEIKRAKELYRQIVETQEEMICRFLPDTTLKFVNPAFCRFNEIPEQELIGHKFINIIPESERDVILEHLEEVKKQAVPVIREQRFIRHNAVVWQYWTVYPIFDAAGGLKEMQAVGTDITRRKQAEEKLRKSEDRLREAQATAKMGDFEYDLLRNEGNWSPHLNQIFDTWNASPNGFYSVKHASRVIQPDDMPRIINSFNEFSLDGKPITVDFRLNRADGKSQYATVTYGKLYRDASGKPVRITGAIQDITERKLKEKELRQAKQSLEKANVSKDWILSVLSHEVRNSLNAIAGFANLLNHSSAITQREDITETLAFSSRHLLALINNIHDFSKIELGTFKLQTEEFDLYDLFEKAAILFQSQLRHHITLNVTIDEQTPRHVKGDATRLLQILNNLVGNAIKFTEKGAISITLKKAPAQDEIQFIIEDTGVGISKERMDRVFEPKHQAGNATNKSNSTNTGLGLYIVSKLVNYVGGTVKLNSEVGKGTAISVTFPVETVLHHVTTPAVETTGLLQDTANYKVLYIEDDYFNHMLMAGYAQLGNLTLDFAKDDQEAYALLQEQTYDIVLTDIVLANTDGAQIAGHIKQQPENRSLPVVAVTAYSEDEIQKQGKNQYFDAVITKPIDPKHLYQLIYHLCSKGEKGLSGQKKFALPFNASETHSLTSLLQQIPDKKEAILKAMEEEIIQNLQTLQQAITQQNYLLFHKTLHNLLPSLYLVEAQEFAVFLRTLEDLPSDIADKTDLQQKLQNFVNTLKKQTNY
ncbi:MAG: PAS domain S-box protein [Cyclobacteriaceae bacterium]